MRDAKRGSETVEFLYRSEQPVDQTFHSHPWYEVYYFHEGSCNYLIGDKIYVLAPGDLILMNGMTLHCPKIDPAMPYVRTIIHFEPSALQPFLEMPGTVDFLQPFRKLTNYRLSLRGPEKEEAERLLADMRRHQQRGDSLGASRMLLQFVDLLHLICDLCSKPLQDKPEAPSEKERTVQRVITYLDERYTEDLHLAQMQADLHLSKFYLSRLFKEVTGVTVFDYVYRRRINQAKILFLLDAGLSVTEVGFRTGFKHLAHFSRLFKQQVGVSPEKYRKSVRESGAGRTRY